MPAKKFHCEARLFTYQFWATLASTLSNTSVDDQICQGWKNRMFWFPIPDSPISAVSEHEEGMS
jgi:hypothetical protein